MKAARDDFAFGEIGGPERDRTADLMLAKHALSQLSYRPKFYLVKFGGPKWNRTTHLRVISTAL